VTSRAAASRYARALFDVTLKEGADVEKVQRELDQFVSLFRSHDVLSQTLGNPAIPASKKVAVVKALLERAGSVSPTLSKLMLLLAERDRLILLPDVLRTYRERLMDHQKVIRGEVTTAMALPADKLDGPRLRRVPLEQPGALEIRQVGVHRRGRGQPDRLPDLPHGGRVAMRVDVIDEEVPYLLLSSRQHLRLQGWGSRSNVCSPPE